MSFNAVSLLLQAQIDGNFEQFLSIALQVAAQEARNGRKKEANKLKNLVDKAREAHSLSEFSHGPSLFPSSRPKNDLEDLVELGRPTSNLSQMVLPSGIEIRLEQFMQQQRERNQLRSYGLKPETSMLLVGPKGTGKSVTASALAAELHLPFFTVKLGTMFNRFKQESGGKLQCLFEQVTQIRGVYLLDDFDGFLQYIDGSALSETEAVSKMLNSLSACIEETNSSDSVVIFASRQREYFEEEFARIFDLTILFDLPDAESAFKFLQKRLVGYWIPRIPKAYLKKSIEGLTQGELVKAAENAVKRSILAGAERVSKVALKKALEERQRCGSIFNNQSE